MNKKIKITKLNKILKKKLIKNKNSHNNLYLNIKNNNNTKKYKIIKN